MQTKLNHGPQWVLGAAAWSVVAWLFIGLTEHALFGLILEQMRTATWQAAVIWLPAATMFVYGCHLLHEAHQVSKEHSSMAPDRTIDNRGGIYNEGSNSGTQTVSNTTNVHPTVREPDGLYQQGNKVGHVQDPFIDSGTMRVVFKVLVFTAYPKPNEPLEFRELLLQCDAIPKPEPDTVVGNLSIMNVRIACRIVGRR
ncbi:MAG TPA: hypothetical protein VGH80_07460 [Xanthomonadaceae bacterium]|jgi:hypothetical protein